MSEPLCFLDSPGPLGFAHRGGAAGGDENTLAAFGRAVALGYRYLETDVQVTADGVVVVFHDRGLRRLTGVAGLLKDRTWAQLADLRIGTEPIPSLEELLAAFPDARLNIDVKSEEAVEPTIATIDRAGAAHRVLLATFNGRRLRRIRALAPHIATSLTPREVLGLRLGTRGKLGGVAAQVPVRYGSVTVVNEKFVQSAHARGIRVHVWTIDDADEMRALLELGVDGIMTDRVDILRDVYLSRGVWTEQHE